MKDLPTIPGQYLNLSTNRCVKNAPDNDKICCSLRGIAIIGVREDIEKYFVENKIRGDLELLLYYPFRDITHLCKVAEEICEYECDIKKKATVVHHKSVDRLRKDEIDSLNLLEPDNMRVEGIVSDVIDGDTFHVVVFIDNDSLCAPRRGGQYNAIKCANTDGGFFAKFCIRLYAVDTVEKHLSIGKDARAKIIELLESVKYRVTVQFISDSKDKYGRSLAVVHTRGQRGGDVMLNDFLVGQMNMAVPYLGGTKDLHQE
jgi:endonuclease YncB( thermonuclease family)